MRMLIPILVLIALPAMADTLVREGATCDVPDNYNTATFNGDYNIRGMGEFCEFPLRPLIDAINDKLEDCEQSPPEIPECETLVISPTIPVYPCYVIRTE